MKNDPRVWYYCLKHKAVEGKDGCRAKDRLGPYDTREEAEQALAIAAERTKEWDEDPKWNDDVDVSESGDTEG